VNGGQYGIVLRRWAWLIVLCALFGALVAATMIWLMPSVYEAEVTLRINPPGADSAASLAYADGRQIETYATLLCTQGVLEEVIANLGLNTTTEELVEHVSAVPVRDTQLIVLTVRDLDPQVAIAIANEIAAVFIEQQSALQSSRYTNTEGSLQSELVSIQETVYETQSALEALGTSTTAEGIAERERLEALLTEYQSSYADLLVSLEEVRRAEASAIGAVTIIAAAQEARPARSNFLSSMLLGALPGGLLGTGVALLFEFGLGRTMETKAEIEALIGTPTLGVIAHIDGDDPLDALITTVRPRSPIAEAYRVLRSNIGLAADAHTILVTSADLLEGKSTTAANLAIAAAQAGKRTILVDANLRRPVLHRLFQQGNESGFTTALMGEEGRASDYLVSTGLPDLLLLPSGPPPPNPTALLESIRLVQLIDELKSQSDVVYFDGSSLLPAHILDATLLSSRCDATLLVVLATSTRANKLVRAKDRLAQAGARLLGVVLNGVRPA
jgi:capsular exopolysaccharide synthesis family protein